MQLCVPFRMALRVGVEAEDTDADADVLGEPRTMLETFGWIAYRVTALCAVEVMLAEGELRVAADGRIRPRTKWPSERTKLTCSTVG